jgi:hypothetical protein
MTELLKKVTEKTEKTVKELSYLIIEELSMVETQFLEWLNRLLQDVMDNDQLFGKSRPSLLAIFTNCLLSNRLIDVWSATNR